MKATAELQVIPIGNGVSVRNEVVSVVEMLKDYNFIIETHASGTNIEGDMNEILTAVENIHTALHEQGAVRLVSYLKLETRTDKTPTLLGKKL
ncbi:MAG: MTH1187 family thiamine-binding protein [Gammaproteobacteria bacterium]